MADSKAFDVTEASFEQDVLQAELPVLVDFWAEWCGPCKMIEPHVLALADEYAGKMLVGRLDTDSNPNVAIEYGIMGIPTLLLFKNGEIVERLTGFRPKDQILRQIQKHI